MACFRLVAVAAIVVLMVGCAGNGGVVAEDGGQDLVADNAVIEVAAEIPREVLFADTYLTDWKELRFPEVGSEDVDQWGPVAGEAGAPCQTANDCLEGFCIQTVDGKQCTVSCVEECPFDWKCVLHTTQPPRRSLLLRGAPGESLPALRQ